MANVIVVGIVLILIGMASYSMVKARKNGQKCIGCPAGCSCSKNWNASESSEECHCGNSIDIK